jgi:predicted RNase H-like HicB family nuclease
MQGLQSPADSRMCCPCNTALHFVNPRKAGLLVSCPALPGCHSQGNTREEAIENINDAIREWLAVDAEENGVTRIEEELVAI